MERGAVRPRPFPPVAALVLALSLACCATPAASPRWLQMRAECQEEALSKVPTNANAVIYDSYVMGRMKARGLDATQPN